MKLSEARVGNIIAGFRDGVEIEGEIVALSVGPNEVVVPENGSYAVMYGPSALLKTVYGFITVSLMGARWL